MSHKSSLYEQYMPMGYIFPLFFSLSPQLAKIDLVFAQAGQN